MRLTWTRTATADRKAIREYIAQHAPKAAIELDELISNKASLLLTHPELGRIGRVAGTRELVAHKNYILIYDLMDGMVRVLRILHTGKQWPN